MANNFKLTGNYYVSIDGSDSNDGLTKDTPKRTVQAGLTLLCGLGANGSLIIGAGVSGLILLHNFCTDEFKDKRILVIDKRIHKKYRQNLGFWSCEEDFLEKLSHMLFLALLLSSDVFYLFVHIVQNVFEFLVV